MPEENRETAQWWFTPDTLLRVSRKLWDLVPQKKIVFLGAPILAYFYQVATHLPTLLLETDEDIIEIMRSNKKLNILKYNAKDKLQIKIRNRFDVVFLDPPWYPPHSTLFLSRAMELVKENGYIVTSLPGLLTRPNEIKARQDLLTFLMDSGCNTISVENGILKYTVPSFEQEVFKNTVGFIELPWRSADLLICTIPRKKSIRNIILKEILPEYETFKQKKEKYRIFLKRNYSEKRLDRITLTQIPMFKKVLSRRIARFDNVDLWTSRNSVFRIKGYIPIKKILNCWKNNFDQQETKRYLIKELRISAEKAEGMLSLLKKKLSIWNIDDSDLLLKGSRLKEEEGRRISSRFGTIPVSYKEREHEPTSDPYRCEFQRDRDRILWSNSFKKLSGKTQMLPWEGAAELRNRLSHTIEVTELANTFARVFKLNEDLTQAIAFAHDIGHPPFGHSGECAINKFFTEISNNRIFFNHYEQALDLINYVETPYLSPSLGGYFGLDLHKEVQEGIFKHMYHMRRQKERNKLNQEEVYKNSKYKNIFKNDFCHLEGQAVRLADKIAYLVEDLEDGIKAKIISLNSLMERPLFQHPLIDILSRKQGLDTEEFISLRRSILKLLMENAIDKSLENIARVNGVEEIRENKDYIIALPDNLRLEIEDIWGKVESGIIHRDEQIVRANESSETVIQFLLKCISLEPDVITTDFRERYRGLLENRITYNKYIKWYENRIGEKIKIKDKNNKERKIKTWQVILAKDYITTLTDNSAISLFRELSGT